VLSRVSTVLRNGPFVQQLRLRNARGAEHYQLGRRPEETVVRRQKNAQNQQDVQTDTEIAVPPERGHARRPTLGLGPGSARTVSRGAGKPAERVHRTQTVAGRGVRRGRLLLGLGEPGIRTGNVFRGAQATGTAADVFVAGGPLLHVPQLLVRIGRSRHRPAVVHQTTNAPETTAQVRTLNPPVHRRCNGTRSSFVSFVFIFYTYIYIYIIMIFFFFSWY